MISNENAPLGFNVVILAVLFGVDEKIFGIRFRGGYTIERLSLVPSISHLDEVFSVEAIELRRLFETAVIDDRLNVACACKKMYFEFHKKSDEDLSEKVNKIINEELICLDNQIRAVRLLTESPIRFKDFVFEANAKNNFTYKSKVPIREGNISLSELSSWDNIRIDYINSNLDRIVFPFKNQLLNQCHILYDLSYHQLTPASSLLLLVICLEILFLDNESSGKEPLAKRCSIFISSNQQEAIEIHKNIITLYRKRSKFVHEGIIDKITKQDILLLREYVRRSLLKWLEDGYTKSELIKSLKERVSSSQYFINKA